MGVLSLSYQFGKYFAFICLRKLFGFLQGCIWLINGTYIRRWRNGHKECQVLDIIFRHKLDLVLEPSGPSNFISTHNSFQNPDYVLKDYVTLYFVTKHEAVFVESDPSVDATHSNVGAFLRVAQFKNAKRIIVMPIAAFHTFADSLPERNEQLVFGTNTARCGSTLLSQLFEETNRALGFSEPDVLNAIGFYEGRMKQEDLDRLVVNSIKVLCKPISRPIDWYLLKPTAPTIDAVPMFIRLFPKSHHIFMYREGLPVARSLARTSTQMPLFELTLLVAKYSKRLTKKGFEAMGLCPDMFKVRAKDPLVFCAYVWAVIIDKYLQFRRQGINIVAIKYEDIVKYPLQSTRAIFEYCGVDLELADEAVRALERDSQRNSPLSKKTLNQHDFIDFTPDKKEVTDQICDQFGLPRIPEPCTIDGTITALSALAETNEPIRARNGNAETNAPNGTV